jgi:hypothetical protein
LNIGTNVTRTVACSLSSAPFAVRRSLPRRRPPSSRSSRQTAARSASLSPVRLATRPHSRGPTTGHLARTNKSDYRVSKMSHPDFTIENGTNGDAYTISRLYRAVAAIEGGLARTADEVTQEYIENFVLKERRDHRRDPRLCARAAHVFSRARRVDDRGASRVPRPRDR